MEEINAMVMTLSSLRIRPSTGPVRFQHKSRGLGENPLSRREKFSQRGLKGDFGDWAGQVEGIACRG
jgi:hypothetical protein